MVSVKEHYDNLLAEHYTWMFGDHTAKVLENREFFQRANITPRRGGKALDLGCGSGFQSIALAELGFEVLGIDLCETLLEELRGRSAGLDINVVQGDMLDYRMYEDKGPYEIAVCMGDTLTHLQKAKSVSTLLENVYRNLENQGILALTFRDFTTELKGVERIIPVRTDEDKLMATFLEYEESYVNVHDMIFLKSDSGWKLQTSVYRKLRIGLDQVRNFLAKTGFEIISSEVWEGFSSIIAQKV